METDYVFVYGSLKRGYRLFSQYLGGSEFVGEATLKNYTIHKVEGAWYPGIQEGKGQVQGEVFKIGPETLKQLDLVEGEGQLYDRVSADVVMAKGETLSVFVYVFKNRDFLGSVIEDGVWKKKD
jgi:gamma-glutamylcyclotransferase (GGCT)/AIG2-like uncharacterized protein YtfP